jgi:Family of unknown function (DUF5906)
MTEFDDELINALTNGSTPVDHTPESIMRWFLHNYGTYNGAVVKLATGKVLSKVLARDEWGAKYIYQVERESGTPANINPIEQLFREMDRIEIQRFGMWPRKSYGYIGNGCFNTFTGWWRKPIEGDITPWFTFVDLVLVDIPGAADFLHDWVASMVQKPWLKHHTFITLAGKAEGTGKSLLGRSIAEMLGTSDTIVTDPRPAPAYQASGDGFLGHFNKQLEGKVFMIVDELGTDKHKHVATMKNLVTSTKFELTAKYQDTVVQDNYCNFIITTNHGTALLVDENSRRDVIFNIQQSDTALIHKVASSLVPWLENGGYENILHWYLTRDVSSFDPRARAPRFLGFERNVYESKTDNVIMCDVFCEAVRDFGKVIALSPGHINFVLQALGYNPKGQQFSRVLSARPEFIESRQIKSKGTNARFTVLGPVLGPGAKSVGNYLPQEALKSGLDFYELHRSVGSGTGVEF